MSDNNEINLQVPLDLPSRIVSLGRVIARLPDGEYTIQLSKQPKRIQAQIIQSVPVRNVDFEQSD